MGGVFYLLDGSWRCRGGGGLVVPGGEDGGNDHGLMALGGWLRMIVEF